MTKRIFLLLTLLIAWTISAFAENVTIQTAQRAAQSFINSKTDGNLEIHLIDFAEKASLPNLYVFGNDHCFVIIAADNAVHPVLGYSFEGGFGTEAIHENTYEWLKAYDEEIAFVAESRLEADDEILSEWNNLLDGFGLIPKTRNSVGPLLRTKWSQGSPFNDLCPADTSGANGHCYTGCAATTMAQIMNYWEHPLRGTGSHSYMPQMHPEYGEQSANFGNTTYDWDNMINYYSRGYTDSEALAVATLMYHCGVSINIEYDPNGTAGGIRNAPYALAHYFDYSSNIVFRYKSYGTTINYSDSLWIEMLKQELDLERPIPYRGLRENSNAGHAFVCDGYDENNYFHFNWGWAGKSDGYFMIGALNPQRDIRGIPNGRGYNRNTGAIFNCYPKTPNISPPSNISSTTNERTVSITWSSVSEAAYYKLYRDGDLIANNLYTTSYTDNNVTYGIHAYYVKSVKSDGTMSLKSNTTYADVHYPGPMPSNLQASVNGNNVNLSWQNPTPENAILQYGAESVTNSFGYEAGTYWAQRFPISTLSNYAGMAIEKVAFYFSSAGAYTISIYKGDISNPRELMHQQNYNASAGSWQDIVFSSPIVIDYTKDLWIVFYSEVANPASYCSYSSTGVEDASLYSETGLRWYFTTNQSWLIKTYITDGTYTYNLYRDGDIRTTNISNNTHTDSNVPVGFYDYNVTTNYFCGESDPSNTIRVRVGKPPCLISTLANPTNGGTITGGGTYNYGQTCTLTAIPSTGYDFVNWTKNGNQVSSSPSFSFTVTEEMSEYVAHFLLQSFTINVSSNPNNGGTVSGGGTYDYGQTCTLTATPATGYDFVNWTKNGNQVSSSPSFSFTVTEAANYVAHFQLQSFTIDASADPSSGGIVSGQGTYDYGQTCTLTATTSPGYTFLRWTKNGTQVSTNSSYSFTVTESASFVAHFQLNNYIVSVTANPSNGGSVSGGGTFYYGDNCTVVATANIGFNFVNWTENGNPVSNQPSYTFTITSDKSLVANFTTQNYIITAIASPTDAGTVSGAGGYNYGDNCILTATANLGYDFQRWTKDGTQVSNDPTYSFTVTESATFVAHFTLESHTINVAANPPEGGIVSGGGTFSYGQTCTVHASANVGFVFVRWMENGTQVSDQPSYSFSVTSDRILTAYFIPIMAYEITAETNPENAGTILGTGPYLSGETATLSIVPNENYLFLNWTEYGTVVSESAIYKFTVDRSRHLIANLQFIEGIDENNDAVEIFPNPATDNIYIKGQGIKRVVMYNMHGQLVKDREVEHQDMVLLNVSSLTIGTYVIRIVTEQGKISKVFVKKN